MSTAKAEPEIRFDDIIRVLPTYPSGSPGGMLGIVQEHERLVEGIEGCREVSHFWKNMLPRLLHL